MYGMRHKYFNVEWIHNIRRYATNAKLNGELG